MRLIVKNEKKLGYKTLNPCLYNRKKDQKYTIFRYYDNKVMI